MSKFLGRYCVRRLACVGREGRAVPKLRHTPMARRSVMRHSGMLEWVGGWEGKRAMDGRNFPNRLPSHTLVPISTANNAWKMHAPTDAAGQIWKFGADMEHTFSAKNKSSTVTRAALESKRENWHFTPLDHVRPFRQLQCLASGLLRADTGSGLCNTMSNNRHRVRTRHR